MAGGEIPGAAGAHAGHTRVIGQGGMPDTFSSPIQLGIKSLQEEILNNSRVRVLSKVHIYGLKRNNQTKTSVPTP